MNCHRCRARIAEGDQAYSVGKPAPPRKGGYYLDGDVMWVAAYYHAKCLPPSLFHKLAGSLPVGQSPAASSLGNEHAAGGGLSSRPNRKRKRPARRQRYIATKRRQQREQQEREQRQHERTMQMTAADVIGRGGKLRLCACKPDAPFRDHFVTSHGYCRYCGGWQQTVIREHLGDAALDALINELELWKRTELRDRLGIAS